MDWATLYFGHVGKQEVMTYIQNPVWQSLRLRMKGVSLERKYQMLANYIRGHEHERAYQVVVTNYVTALSRGGLIKPEDYNRRKA